MVECLTVAQTMQVRLLPFTPRPWQGGVTPEACTDSGGMLAGGITAHREGRMPEVNRPTLPGVPLLF